MRQGIYYVIILEESERKSISERKWDQKLLPYCVTVFVAQCEVVDGRGGGETDVCGFTSEVLYLLTWKIDLT